MKLLLTSFLVLLLPSAIMAVEEDDYIYDCQVQYSITLGATYKDEHMAPSCSEKEMKAIHDLAVSVVQGDFISSLLGTALPEFIQGWESYEAGVVITRNAPLPTPEEIVADMTTADVELELKLKGCGDNNPLCEGLEDKDDEDEGRRHLLELTPEEPKAEREWTPLAHYQEDKNRNLQAFDCPTSRSDCARIPWCCNWCSVCSRRRRNLKRNNGCKTLRTKGEDKADKKARHVIQKFEQRVSNELTTAIRGLAISGGMAQPKPMYTCLGLPDKIFVDFDRHFYEDVCD